MKLLRTQSARKRRGSISMELVLTLPLLMTLLLGIFEFSLLLLARGDVVQASRAGARMATLNGVTENDVQAEVQRTLGTRFGSDIQVETQLAEKSGEEILVTVRVPMGAAAPNLLWPIGYNLQGRELLAETRMVKE